jgi:hypothetical protein
MPTVIARHDVKDKDHWLASPKREEFFGPLGVTNIRTFVDPQNRPNPSSGTHGRCRHRRRHERDGDWGGCRAHGA